MDYIVFILVVLVVIGLPVAFVVILLRRLINYLGRKGG